MSDFERNERRPEEDTARAIIAALGIPLTVTQLREQVGPQPAKTSDALMDKAAERASLRPEFLGYTLFAIAERRWWTMAELAVWLGCEGRDWARLRLVFAPTGDTDTNAAIMGALLGSVYGVETIPQQWQDAVLNCRPDQSSPVPRPRQFWPVDALTLASALLKLGMSNSHPRRAHTTWLRPQPASLR